MKRIIKLQKNEIKNIISESVKRVLNEMGTPKQNAFLKNLMGSRYDPKYDNYSVSDTGKLIQQEIDRRNSNRNQVGNLASQRQLDFIQNNKYYPIPSITQIANKLTKDDAAKMVTALNPYSNGGYTYYGHVRQRKEDWLPEMKDVVVPILEKYGLQQEAQRISTEVDTFMNKFKAKQDKQQQKLKKEKMDKFMNGQHTLFFISTKDQDNLSQHTTERLSRDIYMDGKLEHEMCWDIAELATDMTKMSINEIQSEVQRTGYNSYQTIVLGYDNPCYTVLWVAFDIMGRQTIAGRIVEETDYSKAYNFAKNNLYKQDNGGHI